MSSILTDSEILEAIKEKTIIIEPFDRERLGSNSYDVCLSKVLGVYEVETLDAKKSNPVKYFEIPKEGYVLQPGELYLGCTSGFKKKKKKFNIQLELI